MAMNKYCGGKGSDNFNWRGGVAEYPNHSQMKRVRLKKLKQANYTCQECGGKATEIHHKDKTKILHTIDNLVALCHKCHLTVYHPEIFKKLKRPPKYYGKFTVAEIAAEIKCSLTTVYNQLSGKRKSLRYGSRIEQLAAHPPATMTSLGNSH